MPTNFHEDLWSFASSSSYLCSLFKYIFIVSWINLSYRQKSSSIQSQSAQISIALGQSEVRIAIQMKKEFSIFNLEKLSSKTIELRFVLLLLLLLLRHKLSHSDQDQTRSVLDRIRHDQGFPNLWRKMAGWGWIFRHEFGKSGQDQTRSGLPKFVTENGQLRGDFP